MVAVASREGAGVGERWRHRAPVSEGASGRAIATGSLVAIEGVDAAASASKLAPAGTRAAIAVPLHARGNMAGALVVGSTVDGKHWTQDERELIVAYGRHVEVALAITRANHGLLQALTDPLTGLGNRALLLDRLEHRLARADRGGQPVTVLFLDLDRFKLVNDSLGHRVGDELLVAVSARLRKCVRKDDLCARLGGDEFAVLLVDGSDAAATAARISAVLGRGFELDSREMYQAKRAGPGRYAHFEPTMHAARRFRLDLDTDLRRAIERRFPGRSWPKGPPPGTSTLRGC